ARRELRRRLLRPRRHDVRRSVPHRPRGGAAAPARRDARLLALDAARDVLLERRDRDGGAQADLGLLRDAPVRRARGRAGRVQRAVRRVDPALPRQRVPGRGARRGPAAGGRRVDVPHRGGDRVGAVVAHGGDLAVPEELTEHAAANRVAWAREAPSYVPGAERNWATDEITWGILDVPESRVGLLGDVAGKDVVELGCGTAYVSAWLARRGARPVGVDLTAEQLETARAMQAKHGLEFPLVHSSAEDVPLPDASFDIAFSEYGASIWCDPDLWVAEAARLLRPGGELIFLVNGTLMMLCSPPDDSQVTEELVNDYFAMKEWEWPGEDSVDFHIGYGEW